MHLPGRPIPAGESNVQKGENGGGGTFTTANRGCSSGRRTSASAARTRSRIGHSEGYQTCGSTEGGALVRVRVGVGARVGVRVRALLVPTIDRIQQQHVGVVGLH